MNLTLCSYSRNHCLDSQGSATHFMASMKSSAKHHGECPPQSIMGNVLCWASWDFLARWKKGTRLGWGAISRYSYTWLNVQEWCSTHLLRHFLLYFCCHVCAFHCPCNYGLHPSPISCSSQLMGHSKLTDQNQSLWIGCLISAARSWHAGWHRQPRRPNTPDLAVWIWNTEPDNCLICSHFHHFLYAINHVNMIKI